MKVIIFNDTQNFNGSLNLINENYPKDKKGSGTIKDIFHF